MAPSITRRRSWPAQALAAYGVGLPAMALVRIVAPTFYARHDTATPVRATIIAMACNIALKIRLRLGAGHGAWPGIALGTALGAWINVAVLTWIGRSRALLAIETPVPARAAGSAAGGAGERAPAPGRGAQLACRAQWRDVAALAAAIICAALGYGAVLLLFRGRLPLRRARMRLFVALSDSRFRGRKR